VGWRPEGPLVDCKKGAREVEYRNQSCCERSAARAKGRRKRAKESTVEASF